MVEKVLDYFKDLNSMGQALFIVGVLLILTFIILLITVLKPDKKGKAKKVYGESAITDRETIFEEKMKDINNIMETDINIENDKTKNLKAIVDQLKELETKNNNRMTEIQKYEAEQENTAVISVKELLNITADEEDSIYDESPVIEEQRINAEDIEISEPTIVEEVKEPERYIQRQEIFSPVFGSSSNQNNVQVQKSNEEIEQEKFLNSLKEFRNNL